MKFLKIIIIVGGILGFQAAFANAMLPAGVVGAWLENGGARQSVPELIVFKDGDTFEFSVTMWPHDHTIKCVEKIAGSITSVEQIAQNAYKIEGKGTIVLGKGTPLPGTRSRECLEIENIQQGLLLPVHFEINDLNYVSFKMPDYGDHVVEFKKLYKNLDN